MNEPFVLAADLGQSPCGHLVDAACAQAIATIGNLRRMCSETRKGVAPLQPNWAVQKPAPVRATQNLRNMFFARDCSERAPCNRTVRDDIGANNSSHNIDCFSEVSLGRT